MSDALNLRLPPDVRAALDAVCSLVGAAIPRHRVAVLALARGLDGLAADPAALFRAPVGPRGPRARPESPAPPPEVSAPEARREEPEAPPETRREEPTASEPEEIAAEDPQETAAAPRRRGKAMSLSDAERNQLAAAIEEALVVGGSDGKRMPGGRLAALASEGGTHVAPNVLTAWAKAHREGRAKPLSRPTFDAILSACERVKQGAR